MNARPDVISPVQRDHREIEQMLLRVEDATRSERSDAFSVLVDKLKRPEAAEEEIVHPLMNGIGADDVAEDLVDEENTAKRVLSELDVSASDFDHDFASLKAEVLKHAQHEEREELPRILEREPSDTLERLGEMFERVESGSL
jgi:Hemerythrin HHE cation binding domain